MPALDRFVVEGLVDRVGPHGWTLTAKGRTLRTMLQAGEDLSA